MKRYPYIIIGLISIAFLFHTACSNQTEVTSQTHKISDSSSLTQPSNSGKPDNMNLQNIELAKIYTQAISEFIKAASQKNKTTFDTLYFGKHVYGHEDDFPDIELPELIEGTQIRLVSPEIGQIKQQDRKSLVYVNMMGWIDDLKADFMFVVFSNGAEHQYDYFINFIYNSSTNIFEVNKIEFENFKPSQKRITIYKASK